MNPMLSRPRPPPRLRRSPSRPPVRRPTATARNIGALLRGETADAEATWNAVCLADGWSAGGRDGAALDGALEQARLQLEAALG